MPPRFLLSLIFLLSSGGVASAQTDGDARARELFHDPREAYSSGQYQAAVDGFQVALDLSGMSALYYNIGLTHDRLRHDEEAVTAYRRYSRRGSRRERENPGGGAPDGHRGVFGA